jgi:class 3 adenylate cyclase/tetratricopeptide (TPR) repeat protein
MNCVACHHENRPGAKFCEECAAPLKRACASCGAELRPTAKFCDECGQSVGAPALIPPSPRAPRDYTPKHLADKILQSKSALEGERKQVTVLFADVKGSLELAEQLDPEQWHRILERFFEILTEGVHRFEGTVNQYTGDGIMALFGAPISHEDHAQRACWAALALRDALREFTHDVKRRHGLDFATRIGINSGEVVVGKIGDDLRMDYTAQGHTVGLAQRMEALASGGSIYLSEHTRKLAQLYFALEDLGAFELKGVAEPMHVYELTGVGAARTRFDVSRARGLVRFVGRAAETGTLDAALAAARAGHGAVAGVVAQAGTGKSRLCFEFLEACRQAGLSVHEGRAVAHGKSIPLIPILEIFRSYFGIEDRDDPRVAREKIAGRLLLLDEGFRDVLPVLFDFLGVADPAAPAPVMEAEARQRQLLGVARRLFQRAPAERPAVLLIEDLHWLDGASEVWLRDWVDAVAGTHNLLLLNFRPEYRAEWMQRSHVQQLALAPLGPEAIRELLEDLLGTDPSTAGLAGLIHERTGGNPFFAEEVVQSLIESDHLAGARGRYRLVTPVAKLPVPDTVQALLAARIDRLPERERRVLQTAAVIGKDVRGPILERVVDVSGAELSESLANLRNAEFVYETALYPVAEYSFKHPLTQEVALGSQLGERRRAVHAAVARAIETLDADRLDEQAAVLAHHWEEAGEALAAARWHARAAGWSMRSDTAAAHRHWLRVKELAATIPLDEARELEGTALVALVNLGWRMGRPTTESRELFDAARRLFEASGDRRSLCLLYSNFSLVATTTGGDFSESVGCYRESTRLARELADPWLELTVGVAIRPGILAGLLREALGWANACIELIVTQAPSGPLLSGYDPQAWIYSARAYMRALLGDIAGAIADSDRALDLARELHDFDRFLAQWTRSEIDVLRGELGGALEHGRRSMELSEKLGDLSMRPLGRASLANAFGRADRWQEARPLLDECRALKDQIGASLGDPGLASALLHCGEPERALIIAREGAAETASLGAQLTELQIQIELAEIAARCGHEAESRGALARASDLAARTECRMLVPAIHEAAAVLAETLGDGGRQQAELREALRLYQTLGATGHAERLGQERAS